VGVPKARPCGCWYTFLTPLSLYFRCMGALRELGRATSADMPTHPALTIPMEGMEGAELLSCLVNEWHEEHYKPEYPRIWGSQGMVWGGGGVPPHAP